MTSHHELSKSARLPHREFEEVREVDPDGRIVVHNRLVDSLGRMRKSGAIDEAMYDLTLGSARGWWCNSTGLLTRSGRESR